MEIVRLVARTAFGKIQVQQEILTLHAGRVPRSFARLGTIWIGIYVGAIKTQSAANVRTR